PNAWKPHYRQGGFVYSFQSYRRSPDFGAAANKISAGEPMEPLGRSSTPPSQATIEEREGEIFFSLYFWV
ncbi:MAG: hypothetical protein WCB52_17880, partial [Pseudolabrys sp.]